MSSIGKVFVVLNLVFSLVVLGVVGAILAKSNEFKGMYDREAKSHVDDKAVSASEKQTLDETIRRLNGDKRQAEERISGLESQVKGLEGDKTSLTADLNTLKGDLAKLQSDYAKFTSTLEAVQTHNANLTKENGELREAKHTAEAAQVAAQQDLARANSAIERLNADVAQLKAEIDERDAKIDDAAAQIEAAIQSGFDISKVRAQPQIDGVVQSVNAQLGLVVLSVGADVGVTRGMKFAIYGDNQYKGEVVVDDVYPDNAAARILSNVKGTQALIAVSDKATTRL